LGLIRVILLLAVVALVVYFIRRHRMDGRAGDVAKLSVGAESPTCANCGIAVARGDAEPAEDGQFYCSAHAPKSRDSADATRR